MADVGIKELLESGVHFGHQTRRWNPKMRRFIHGERGGIYIIDLLKTQALLEQAQQFSSEVAHRGGTVLFVGTKKQARDSIKEVAENAGMPFVNHRWLGGLLTNFQTISLRIKRLHDLERYETEGQLDAAPDARAHGRPGRPGQAPGEPRRRQEHAAPARRDVRRRPQDRGHRGPGGQAPADPDHRPGRHQLRPGRHRLRDPGQRRRDQVLRDHHAGDRRRRLRGLHDVPRRGGARAQGGRGAGPQGGRGARRPRGGGAPAQGGRGGRRAPGRA